MVRSLPVRSLPVRSLPDTESAASRTRAACNGSSEDALFKPSFDTGVTVWRPVPERRSLANVLRSMACGVCFARAPFAGLSHP